jgi:hypothetical protein
VPSCGRNNDSVSGIMMHWAWQRKCVVDDFPGNIKALPFVVIDCLVLELVHRYHWQSLFFLWPSQRAVVSFFFFDRERALLPQKPL